MEVTSAPTVTWTLFAAALTLFAVFLAKRWRDFRLFIRCNVNGPKPHFILGNLKDLDNNGQGTKAGFLDLERKFGKTFGIFFGSIPNIITSDPTLLKQVFIKDFHHFADRKIGIIPLSFPANRALSAVHYERWKPIRSIISPFFSAAKLKKMMPSIGVSVAAFLQIISDKLTSANRPEIELDVVPLYQRLALDVLNLSAFGLDTNSQREGHYLLDTALQLVEGANRDRSLRLFLCLICQDLIPLAKAIGHIFNLDGPTNLARACQKLIRNRKADFRSNRVQSKYDDVIKLMLQHEIENPKDMRDDVKALTEDEIAMQAMQLIVGGFETTSRTLSYISFFLANNPQVQSRLYSRICEVLPPDDDSASPSYEDLMEMEYLDMIVNETLRLCPPVPFGVTNRIASRDCSMPNILGEEILIKKGVLIAANIWALHYDPDVWPDPETFDPERFTKEASSARDPVYFMPFGLGQRNCIGRRFATIEIKMALTQILRHFEMLPSPNEEKSLNPKMMDFGAKNVVRVILKRRIAE